jgi:phosphoenolpyruvate synthase/pyruvate phosphate dikinase
MSDLGRYALRLRGSGAPGTTAGGKGAALDRLVAMGAPVPPSGVLTTDSYRAFSSLTTRCGDHLDGLRCRSRRLRNTTRPHRR